MRVQAVCLPVRPLLDHRTCSTNHEPVYGARVGRQGQRSRSPCMLCMLVLLCLACTCLPSLNQPLSDGVHTPRLHASITRLVSKRLDYTPRFKAPRLHASFQSASFTRLVSKRPVYYPRVDVYLWTCRPSLIEMTYALTKPAGGTRCLHPQHKVRV